MKERILEFLRSENKSSAQLAEEINVQPSGISHILSGRNNPSLDFVLKMLERYKYLSTEWLLFGKGEMFREKQAQSLFDESFTVKRESESDNNNISYPEKTIDFQEFNTKTPLNEAAGHPLSGNNKVIKIVWFYDNNSFEEFLPR
jgi:transcriptional regulator with XRE-family HTH domain